MTKIILTFVLAVSLSAAYAADKTYVTAFTGTHFTLIFPAPDIAKNTRIFRDAIWAIDIIDVLCDERKIDGHEVGPAGVIPMPVASASEATLIYTCRVSELIVCSELEQSKDHFKFVEYRIPEAANKIVIKYRIRIPGRGTFGDVHTITSYARPYFPSGVEVEPDQKRG